MTLHLEWLRNNPKGPHGPIPQRAPKAPLGPFAPLGSLWFPWSLLAPCPWVPGPLGVGWGWGPWAKGSAPCRSDIRASRNCGGEAALPRRECTGSAGLRASVMDFMKYPPTLSRACQKPYGGGGLPPPTPSALGVATGQPRNPWRVLLKSGNPLGGSRLKRQNPAAQAKVKKWIKL